MRTKLALFFCLISINSFGQNSESSFPDSWLGEWIGTLDIYGPQGVIQSLEMELHISEEEGEGSWGWTIIYKGETTDERKYELQLKDPAKSHYVIDEKNSILLDGYYLGNTLVTRFSVNRSLLMINYTFEEGQIIFDVFSGSLDTSVKTGEEITQVEEIRSYQIGNRQRAILKLKE